MSLLVVMNRGDSGLGMFTRELQTRFEQIEVCYREEILQLKVQSFPRALILLGSDWSVCDPSVTHQVDAEVSLLKKLSEREVPVLGVCYGAQLIAHAFLLGVVPKLKSGGPKYMPTEIIRFCLESGCSGTMIRLLLHQASRFSLQAKRPSNAFGGGAWLESNSIPSLMISASPRGWRGVETESLNVWVFCQKT